MITLRISKTNLQEGEYIYLPTSESVIDSIFSKLPPTEPEDAGSILEVKCEPVNLCNYLRNAKPTKETILQLNHLAWKLAALRADDLRKFGGALDTASISSIDDIYRIVDSLDDYILVHGVSSPRELGGFLADNGFLNIPPRLQPYIDYTAIGDAYYSEHGGAFCTRGYVLKFSDADFCLREGERCQINKYWLDKEDGMMTWLYYNPDNDAGRQYVEVEASAKLVKEALESSSDPSSFQTYIHERGSIRLIEADDIDLEDMDRYFLVTGCDFTDLTDATMQQIADFADIEPNEEFKQRIGGM